MDNQKFQQVLKQCHQSIDNVLNKKAQEYATGSDRLHNFAVAAKLMGTTTPYACMGMLNKHLISIRDIVVDYEKQNKIPTIELLDEKIGDAINYLILLKACFLDNMPNKTKTKKQ